ncbi:MAG: hypothetical protein R3Y62_02335 [Eubacteriales bacterium]
MKNLEQVTKLFQDQAAVKVISTASAEGEVHSIVAGSIMSNHKKQGRTDMLPI